MHGHEFGGIYAVRAVNRVAEVLGAYRGPSLPLEGSPEGFPR